MEEQKRRNMDRGFHILTLILVVGLLGYLLYSVFVRKAIGREYPVVMIGFLIVLWGISDVLPVLVNHSFEGKTEEQKKGYLMYALCNLVGYAGLGYFALSFSQNTGMYGALVYAGSVMLRRRFLDTYKGITPEEEKDPEIPNLESALEDAADVKKPEREPDEVMRETADQLPGEVMGETADQLPGKNEDLE